MFVDPDMHDRYEITYMKPNNKYIKIPSGFGAQAFFGRHVLHGLVVVRSFQIAAHLVKNMVGLQLLCCEALHHGLDNRHLLQHCAQLLRVGWMAVLAFHLLNLLCLGAMKK